MTAAEQLDRAMKLLALAFSDSTEEARTSAVLAVRMLSACGAMIIIGRESGTVYRPSSLPLVKFDDPPRPVGYAPPGWRWIVSKFDSYCRECGSVYATGTRVLWRPKTHELPSKVICQECVNNDVWRQSDA